MQKIDKITLAKNSPEEKDSHFKDTFASQAPHAETSIQVSSTIFQICFLNQF